MATARALNLRVRPLQSVDLAFPIDGIIGGQSDIHDIHLLGKPVKAFDLNHFYGLLGDVIVPSFEITGSKGGVLSVKTFTPCPQPLGWGRLRYDSAAIYAALRPFVLFELRAEHIKAAVDKGV